ncbi:hypothetical protein D3C73_1578260 [compost metagenome]
MRLGRDGILCGVQAGECLGRLGLSQSRNRLRQSLPAFTALLPYTAQLHREALCSAQLL